MKLSIERLVSRRPSAALASLALGAAAVFASPAFAQTAEAAKPATTTNTTPSLLFQDSALTSSTDTVNATRVPVVSSNGTITYYDIALLFDVGSNGEPILSAGYPKITPSANPNSANFKAGTYVGASNIDGGKDIIVVSGPSVLPGGGTAWTLAAGSGASGNTTPGTAVWYVEPSIAENPLASRITKAGITNSQLSYGAAGVGGYWCEDSLLGFSQVGNSLTISDYTNLNTSPCKDLSTPADQRTYTLQQ